MMIAARESSRASALMIILTCWCGSSLAISIDQLNSFKADTFSLNDNSSSGENWMQTLKEETDMDALEQWTEIKFIFILATFAVPANLFLFIFYARKVFRYKTISHLNVRYARIAKSFHTYMLEMCLFDSLIVLHLVVNSGYQFAFFMKQSQYESVFDVSNFACKFFIYILRISGAMNNYLVFLLAINRCFLIMFKYKPAHVNSRRLCFNTKYLTLFLFCICTIANVFRLEILNIGHEPDANSETSGTDFDMRQMLKEILKSSGKSGPECMPAFVMGDTETDAYLFSTIITYNVIFSITPALCNLIVGVFLIIKRHEYKKRLDLLLHHCYKSKMLREEEEHHRLERIVEERSVNIAAALTVKTDAVTPDSPNDNNLDEIVNLDVHSNLASGGALLNQLPSHPPMPHPPMAETDDGHPYDEFERLKLSEFDAEFLKTCTPCIAFSLTHAILFLPYSCIDIVNQFKPHLTFMALLQYMTYARYIFYCCKFYLLFMVSYKFRRGVFKFFDFRKS